MNPLKEHPYLFGNGKFKVKVGKEAEYITTFQPYINETSNSFYHNGFNMNECTLIARPISDMTDEEKRKEWELRGAPDNATPKSMLYLLSIGVYPFSQSHFDDGTVLNINEV